MKPVVKPILFILLGCIDIVVLVACFIRALPSPSFLLTAAVILNLIGGIRIIKMGIVSLRAHRDDNADL